MAAGFTLSSRLRELKGIRASIRTVHLHQTSRTATPCFGRRFASTNSEPTVRTTNAKRGPLRKIVFRSSLVLVLLGGYFYFTDTRASAHRYIAVPLIRWLYPDAEDAHHSGVIALKELYKWGLHPRERSSLDQDGKLATEVKRTFSFYRLLVTRCI